jgi:hypothetical protein
MATVEQEMQDWKLAGYRVVAMPSKYLEIARMAAVLGHFA